jgi:hypothetical protein
MFYPQIPHIFTNLMGKLIFVVTKSLFVCLLYYVKVDIMNSIT